MDNVATMAGFLYSHWWLLFPLAFFLIAGWNSYMRYKRTQAKIDLLKTYAASGKEPPADLVASLDKSDHGGDDWDDDDSSGSGRGSGVFLIFLFTGLSGVFAYVGWSGLLGDDSEAFYFIAMILGVLALAFFAASIAGMFNRRR